MSWPNRITLGRILLIGPFVIAILHINEPKYHSWMRYGALVIFLVMAISDALDGYLARRNNSVTKLGSFLDPLADKLLITFSCLLLSGDKTSVPGMQLPDTVMVVIIGKDLYTVLGFIIIFLITSEMKIVPVMVGKLSTALQLTMVAAILISPEMREFMPGFAWVVRGLWWAATGLAIITVISYTRNGTRYMNEYETRKRKNEQAQG